MMGLKSAAALLSVVISALPSLAAESKTTFETNVLPIITANCVGCHGPKVRMKELDLSNFAAARHGGESGPVVVPGKPEESLLYKKVHEGLMPPGGKSRLSDEDIGVIRSWIESGAHSNTEKTEEASARVTQHDIVPIVMLRCTVCHGLRRQEADLDLRSKASMLKGGKSGPAMVLGKPDESLVIQKVRAGLMPPKPKMLEFGVKPMTEPELQKLARWIAADAPEVVAASDSAGTAADPLITAKDRQFWSFEPPHDVEVPKVRNGHVRTPIDAFILQKLEEKGLTLSPEADKLTLIRRVTFDLTGLPPTPEEAQAFAADNSPDAYEKLVDRLLASPRYGERWGQHWLDLAGYADSYGGKLSADHPRPYAWRYRDYVIRSYNADKPYDRFLIEQIAGDELTDYEHAPVVTAQMLDNVIATGFLAMGPDSTSEREVNFVDDRLDVIGDEVDILTSGVMGLTVRCARCHNHKYDPLPQRDYYRFLAIFKGAFDENDWLTPFYNRERQQPGRVLPYVKPGATPFELAEDERSRELHNKEIDKQLEALKADLDQAIEPLKKKLFEQRLTEAPKPLHEDLRAVFATAPDKQSELQKYLAAKFGRILKIDIDDLKEIDAKFKGQAEILETKIKWMEARKLSAPRIQAVWDRGAPSPAYILRRGDPASFGPPIEPGPPAVLTNAAFEITPPWPNASKTGRRLAFAKWLTRPDNPLTARVMVNRMWKQHFGTGIVKTLGNFGHAGSPPSHPELLDWLSREFIRQGWSMKSMHRLMVTSSVYRQRSTVTPVAEKLDPENRLLSRMPMRRLDAESLDDTMRSIAGRLDEAPFGPADPVFVRKDGLVTAVEGDKGWRRSIYIQHRRSEMPTVLESFDLPPMSPNCLERTDSTVAPQALHLMNNSTIQKLAGYFARRVEKEAGSDRPRQIDRAYWLALSRAPNPEEKKISLEALERFTNAGAGTSADPWSAGGEATANKALAKLCHTLMNSAAFLYVD